MEVLTQSGNIREDSLLTSRLITNYPDFFSVPYFSSSQEHELLVAAWIDKICTFIEGIPVPDLPDLANTLLRGVSAPGRDRFWVGEAVKTGAFLYWSLKNGIIDALPELISKENVINSKVFHLFRTVLDEQRDSSEL